MRNFCDANHFDASAAEWMPQPLHSWKEIASFFRKEVRTVQLWEKSEGLPVRRQQHKKLGSVYAYRHELEAWWIKRSKLSAHAGADLVAGAKPACLGSVRLPTAELGRILVFPLEVVPAQRDRGPLQQGFRHFAAGLKDDLNLELTRSRFDPICLTPGALPLHGGQTPGFLRNIAREFRAECYLTGVIRSIGDVAKVSIQLIRSSDSVCLWSDRFERTLDSLSHVQEELARAIVQALPGPVAPGDPAHLRARTTEPPPAYHACMMGVYFWKQRTRADLMKSLGYFQDAIQLDPSYADAYAGLADTYVALSYNHAMPAREAAEAGHRAIARAKSLDPESVNVCNAEINFKTNCIWDWQAAERAYQEIDHSGNADARTLQLYANLMINRGRHDDAVSLALHAYRLDPLSDSVATQVSYAYFYAGDYDNAVSFTRRAIVLKPCFNILHALLGRAEAQRGNWDEAVEAFDRGLALARDSTVLKALLAYGYAGRGDAAAAYKLLREIEEQRGDPCFPAVDVSAVYAMLNHETEALKNISQACDLGDMKLTYLRYDPRFNRLGAHARFKQFDPSAYPRAGCSL